MRYWIIREMLVSKEQQEQLIWSHITEGCSTCLFGRIIHHKEPQAGLVGCWFETVMLVEDLESLKFDHYLLLKPTT